MESSSKGQRGWRQFGRGLTAALGFVVVQLLVRLLAGVQSIVEIIQDRFVLLLPGPIFSFVLDRLLYLGKPLFFATLLLGVVVVLGVIGVVAIRLREPALFAAGLWLLAGLVELVATGQGFFAGRADFALSGLVSFAAYGGILLWLDRRETAEASDRGGVASEAQPNSAQSLLERRELVGAGVLFVAAVVLARQVIGTLPSLPRSGASTAGAGGTPSNGTPVGATAPLASLPSRVTTPTDFYVVSKNLVDPVVDSATWSLTVTGTVNHATTFTYAQLRALPSVQIQRTLECISNEVGGDLISNGVWTGVKLADLAQLVSPLPLTSLLRFASTDGYTESMPIEKAMDPNAILAYELDGAPLPPKHGFPARILGPGTYGMKNPKWITEIQFARSAAPGFWEQQGWNPDAIVQTMARIDTPAQGATLTSGNVTIAGIAYAGDRGIKNVDVSSDGGSSWLPATLLPPVTPNVWTFWQATWQPTQPGPYTLTARATDGTGQVQSGANADTYPTGATGYHKIQVVVG